MLPSTGYFKTINCPFYDNGFCERPYCHFKHQRREDAGNAAASVATAAAQKVPENHAAATTTAVASQAPPDRLQQLVTEAVKQVLARQEVTDADKISENIVSQVVEELKPSLDVTTSALTSTSTTVVSNVTSDQLTVATPVPVASKPVPCVYNPTPIAELRKRHIPVASYMPTRERRVAVKRKASPDSAKPWFDIFKESTAPRQVSAMPGYSSVKVDEVIYKPTAIVSLSESSSVHSYVPTAKSDSSNSFEDSNSNDYTSKVKEAYCPKSKKKREEYVPKKVKAPLKSVQRLDKVATLDDFKEDFTTIEDVLTSDKSRPDIPLSDDSSNIYDLDVEPKFSDDEMVDETMEHFTKETNKLDAKLVHSTSEALEEKENKNEEYRKDTEIDNKSNLRNNHRSINSSDKSSDGTADSRNVSKSRDKESKSVKMGEDSHESRSGSKHSKAVDASDLKKSRDSVRKEHRSNDTYGDKNDKSHARSSEEKRDKRRSSSCSRQSSPSSSRKKHKSSRSSRSDKSSSSKSKQSSKPDKSKSSSSKHSGKHRHKSSTSDRHRNKSSSSSPKSSKHSSEKHSDGRERRRGSNTKSSTKSSGNSKKRKDSGSDCEERSASPTGSAQSSSFLDEELLRISDSEHDIEEECLKIFQEYEISDHPKEVTIKEPPKRGVEEFEDNTRKRVAHPSAGTGLMRQHTPSEPEKKLPTAQQRMYERWRLMRKVAAEKAAEKAAERAAASGKAQQVQPETSCTRQNQSRERTSRVQAADSSSATTSSEVLLNGNARARIAHVPYAKSLALAKKKVTESAAKLSDSRTPAQTTKSGPRVAHVPQAVPLVRPEPLQVTTQKFPLNVRQYYVNLMQDICVQIYTNGEDAAQRALREEFACHERCKAVAVYKNSCMLAAHRLRKELDQGATSENCPSSSGMVSHEAVLAGKSKGSWSVVKVKKAVTDFKGAALYAMLAKWIMTEQQLRDNGFPRSHPDGSKGRAKVYVTNARNQTVISKVPNERFCSRCGQSYMVNRLGFAVRQQNCIYHWGRKFTIRGEGRYSCCQQYGSAGGCCDATTHVWDYVDYENLRGYIKTLPTDIPAENQGVYALDCEMCYTTQGLELTRVTVINEDCKVIYESLVMPENPIIDYNTRFSGITEENMKGVTTTLLDVQATLLTMFSEKTILVGHSLESDFKALKLIHDTVVDTSIMFPHKNGYPQKRALRNLCSEYLRKIIQNDVGGHDSNEDAVSCMELIRWKVKEEAKLQ